MLPVSWRSVGLRLLRRRTEHRSEQQPDQEAGRRAMRSGHGILVWAPRREMLALHEAITAPALAEPRAAPRRSLLPRSCPLRLLPSPPRPPPPPSEARREG